MLVDDYGRETTDIRVSLTDRCNFDCRYCHNEGLGDTRGPTAPQDGEMSTEDVLRVLRVAHEFDVERVKFTGGEPMLRRDLEDIVRGMPSAMEASLTTNGTFLPGRADELAAAGLARVNVSLDTLSPESFAELTNSGAYHRVLEGVEAAREAGLTPVKLNMVVFDRTIDYIPDMVEYASETPGLRLQLVEYMPEIAGHPEWTVDMEPIHEWLSDRADRIERRQIHDRRQYWVGDTVVEIVDPVGNRSFCENCQRIRVAPDGSLLGCLNRPDDRVSMGTLGEAEIREAFRRTVRNRVPYYGEYLTKNEDGEWVQSERYVAEH